MTRRCSHCNNNGHNSRTCPTRGGVTGGVGGGSSGGGGVRLFGVRLTDGSIMKKSASMGNLSSLHYHSSSSAAASPNPGSPSSDVLRESVHLTDGYLSDDPAHASSSANHRIERKKGIPWTEEEHRLFLIGLQKLGKGDWRGISRNFVTSRTPTQVASHAQKYFIRQSNATRRKRRSSLFDIVADTAADASHPLPEEQFMLPPRAMESDKEQLGPSATKAIETDFADSLPSLDLSLKSDFESMETVNLLKKRNQTPQSAKFLQYFQHSSQLTFQFHIPSGHQMPFRSLKIEEQNHLIIKSSSQSHPSLKNP